MFFCSSPYAAFHSTPNDQEAAVKISILLISDPINMVFTLAGLNNSGGVLDTIAEFLLFIEEGCTEVRGRKVKCVCVRKRYIYIYINKNSTETFCPYECSSLVFCLS